MARRRRRLCDRFARRGTAPERTRRRHAFVRRTARSAAASRWRRGTIAVADVVSSVVTTAARRHFLRDPGHVVAADSNQGRAARPAPRASRLSRPPRDDGARRARPGEAAPRRRAGLVQCGRRGHVEAKLRAAVAAKAWPDASTLLRRLSAGDVSLDIIKTTSIGKTVAELKKAEDGKLATAAKGLVARWKQMVRDADAK